MRQHFAFSWLAGFCLGLGCGMAVADDVPLPRPRPPAPPAWTEPKSFREAAGPDFKTTEVTSAPSDCRLRLEAIAAIAPMPRLVGPGACGGGDLVELAAVLLADKTRIEVNPAPLLRCAMAEQLAVWIRDDAAPRVAKIGEVLRSVETYDDYSCRGRNRIIGAKMSEHGKGNAVDVRAFTVASKPAIMLTDMKASKELREAMRESACARFTTVLGPGSDGYHEQHIHLDLSERRNGYRICQWAVREPPAPTPLPPPKPVVAAEQVAAEQVAAAPIITVRVPLPVPRPHIAVRPMRGQRRL